MTTDTKARAWDSYSACGVATRQVETRIVVDATPDGLHLAVNDCRTPADEDDDLVSLRLGADVAVALLCACWRYFEMTGRDPVAVLKKARA